MNKILHTLLFILLTQIGFSQAGFCLNTQTDPPFGGMTGKAIAKADFNNDGVRDICIQAIPSGSMANFAIGVLLSNGTGSYTSFSPYGINTHSVLANLTNLISGDFNSDGNQDLIATNIFDSAFFLLKGNGAGTFSSVATFTTNGIPKTLIAADFNNDNKPDLAYSCTGTNSLTIRYCSGTGFLTPANYLMSNTPDFLVCGMFNSDSYVDLFVKTGTTFCFLKGGASGTYTLISGYSLNASYILAVDVNSDSKTDLVYTEISTNKIYILKRNGDFTFNPPNTYSVNGLAGSIALGKIECGDFNNDGKIDLATISSTNCIAILPGTTNGNFLSPLSYSVNFTNANYINNFIVVDINNDLRQDIVTLANDPFTPFSEFKLLWNCNTVDVGLKESFISTEDITLFPNPAKDYLTIKSMNEGLWKDFKFLKIYTSLGQLIQEEEINIKDKTISLNVNNLAEGVYFLQLKSNTSGNVSKKFVISR